MPLILPATDIGNGGVHVFKSNYSKDFVRDHNIYVWEAVLASCSAPTFFDPVKVDKYALADGGLWANNPSLCATIDALHRLGTKLECIRVLALGTGHSRNQYSLKLKRRWGLATGWKRKQFISFLLSLQSQSAHNYLRLLLKPDQLLRLEFESDNELPLDDINSVDSLISRADRLFTHEGQAIKNFLSIK